MGPRASPTLGGLAPPGMLAGPAGRDLGGEGAAGLSGAGLPDDLERLLAWFVTIRWVFAAGLAATILLGARLLGASFPAGRAAGVGAAILAYNALFLLHHRLHRARPPPAARANQVEALLQIGLDLLALTALVHFSGGAESPFIILYVIHAIAASMLLPRRLAWLVGGAAFFLLLVVVVLEYEAVLPDYRPEPVHDISRLEQRPIRIALSLAFLVAMGSAMAITSAIMAGLRRWTTPAGTGAPRPASSASRAWGCSPS